MKNLWIVLLSLMLATAPLSGCGNISSATPVPESGAESSPVSSQEPLKAPLPEPESIYLMDMLDQLDTDFTLDESIDLKGRLQEMEPLILDGSLTYSMSDLFIYYNRIMRESRIKGEQSGAREMVQRYIRLCEKYYTSKDILTLDVEDIVEIGSLGDNYHAILIYGLDYDDIVIQGLENLSEYYASYEKKATDENIQIDEISLLTNSVSSIALHFNALILRKEIQNAGAYALEYPDIPFLSDLMNSSLLLLKGDAEASAAIDSVYNQQLKESLGEDVFRFEVQRDLDRLYVNEQRGMLTKETIFAYLDALSAKASLQIKNSSGNAERAGFMDGDIIVSLNGEKVYSYAQAFTILDNNNQVSIEISRGGQPIVIPVAKADNNRYGIGIEIVVQ